jgi:hypothetical protein
VLTPGQPRWCVPAGQQLPLELVQRGHWKTWPAPPQPLHSSAVDRTARDFILNLTFVPNFKPARINCTGTRLCISPG